MSDQDRDVKRQIRGLKRYAHLQGLLILVLGAVLIWMAMSPPGVLTARGLVIVDEAGRERILLGAPIPAAANRVRTDLARVKEVWGTRGLPTTSPEQYMEYYQEYRHDMHGILILDEQGFDRLAVGDSVPDLNVGKRIAPGTGVFVNDEQGDERAGYGMLRVGKHARVVLGLDTDEGPEGLVLALFDQGGIGLRVRDGQRSAFLGSAGPGEWAGMPKGFHGLVFKEGDKIVRQIEAR